MPTDERQEAVAEGLPEEVADAWAAVLIDIYEKRKASGDAKPEQADEVRESRNPPPGGEPNDHAP
jgi:hypothetical protein